MDFTTIAKSHSPCRGGSQPPEVYATEPFVEWYTPSVGVDEHVDPSAALPPQPVGADRIRPKLTKLSGWMNGKSVWLLPLGFPRGEAEGKLDFLSIGASEPIDKKD